MAQTNVNTDTAIDPVCGKTFDTREIHFTIKDDKGLHYFCSEACRRKYDSADAKTKKGFWAKYTERLQSTHCTRTPPECR